MLKTYKCKNPGIRTVSVTKNKDGKEWKIFATFERHTLTTDDPDVQKKVEELLEAEKNLPLQSRELFTVEQWDEAMTPDKVFIEDGKGGIIHRAILLEAFEFALSKGFKPKEKIIVDLKEANAEQGTQMGGKKK